MVISRKIKTTVSNLLKHTFIQLKFVAYVTFFAVMPVPASPQVTLGFPLPAMEAQKKRKSSFQITRVVRRSCGSTDDLDDTSASEDLNDLLEETTEIFELDPSTLGTGHIYSSQPNLLTSNRVSIDGQPKSDLIQPPIACRQDSRFRILKYTSHDIAKSFTRGRWICMDFCDATSSPTISRFDDKALFNIEPQTHGRDMDPSLSIATPPGCLPPSASCPKLSPTSDDDPIHDRSPEHNLAISSLSKKETNEDAQRPKSIELVTSTPPRHTVIAHHPDAADGSLAPPHIFHVQRMQELYNSGAYMNGDVPCQIINGEPNQWLVLNRNGPWMNKSEGENGPIHDNAITFTASPSSGIGSSRYMMCLKSSNLILSLFRLSIYTLLRLN